MEFTLTVTEQEVYFIGAACLELPKKIADPLIAKLQEQVNAQIKAAQPLEGEVIPAEGA